MSRASIAWMVAVAGVMAGCGSVRVEPGGGGGQGGAATGFQSKVPPYVAGTRLTPRFLDGGDGAKVLFDFFDHQLGTTCAFIPASDTRFRCMPETPVGSPALSGFPACTGSPAAASALTYNTCSEVIATGGLMAPAGSLAPEPLQDLRSRSFQGANEWPGATPVPLDSFVGGTIELVPVDGNLSVERLVADDGTTVTIGFARDGHRCEAAHFGSELRCLDTYQGYTHTWTSDPSVPLFVGTSCTGERAGFFSPSCDKPKPGLASTLDEYKQQCPSDGQYFELLEPVGDCSAQVNQDCIPMPAAGYASQGIFARLGAEVPPSALPKMTETEIAGTGRLRVRALVGGGAVLGSAKMRFASNDTTFFDTTLGTSCTARVVSGDEVRCLPGGEGVSNVYQDPGCTIPLMAPDDDTCGVVAEHRFLVRTGGTPCGNIVATEVWERGEPYTGKVYGNSADIGCFDAGKGGNWFQVGTKHPLSDFAVVSLTAP